MKQPVDLNGSPVPVVKLGTHEEIDGTSASAHDCTRTVPAGGAPAPATRPEAQQREDTMTPTPYLIFHGTCRQAMARYAEIFGGENQS